MEKIRFGIVGIGMMGRMHATSLQRNPHAEVVAVCARTESKGKGISGGVRRTVWLRPM